MNTPAHTQTGQHLISRYAPHQTPPLVLNSISTNTHRLLTNLQEQITANLPSGSTHHILLHGPQGCGKSHTLTLLWH
ncbi:MAG: ATP-binding protein, partial [Planctomyces sp.]